MRISNCPEIAKIKRVTHLAECTPSRSPLLLPLPSCALGSWEKPTSYLCLRYFKTSARIFNDHRSILILSVIVLIKIIPPWWYDLSYFCPSTAWYEKYVEMSGGVLRFVQNEANFSRTCRFSRTSASGGTSSTWVGQELPPVQQAVSWAALIAKMLPDTVISDPLIKKDWKARSRLYRGRRLQADSHVTSYSRSDSARFDKTCTLLQRSRLGYLAKFRQIL